MDRILMAKIIGLRVIEVRCNLLQNNNYLRSLITRLQQPTATSSNFQQPYTFEYTMGETQENMQLAATSNRLQPHYTSSDTKKPTTGSDTMKQLHAMHIRVTQIRNPCFHMQL